MPNRITGRYLNKIWNVGVDHALYSHDGTWYHQLSRFPGALFDSRGYVTFQTESDFRNCPQLRISKDVGCPKGIRNIPKYITVAEGAPVDITPSPHPERVNQIVSRIVRDTIMSSAIKLLYENSCQICGVCVDLGNRTYSEAHHIRPLGDSHVGPDEESNLICVCPTCHVLLDYAAIPLSIHDLQIVRHEISQDHILYHNCMHEEKAQPEGRLYGDPRTILRATSSPPKVTR